MTKNEKTGNCRADESGKQVFEGMIRIVSYMRQRDSVVILRFLITLNCRKDRWFAYRTVCGKIAKIVERMVIRS